MKRAGTSDRSKLNKELILNIYITLCPIQSLYKCPIF